MVALASRLASHLPSLSRIPRFSPTVATSPTPSSELVKKKTYVGARSEEIAQWSEALFRRPVENGQVVSWEAQKEIWDQSFFDERTAAQDVLIKHPDETTLIFTEPPNSMSALQKNADEIIMEEWGFGGYTRVIGRYGHGALLFCEIGSLTPGRSFPQCIQRPASSV